jgi:hypothetical protein
VREIVLLVGGLGSLLVGLSMAWLSYALARMMLRDMQSDLKRIQRIISGEVEAQAEPWWKRWI